MDPAPKHGAHPSADDTHALEKTAAAEASQSNSAREPSRQSPPLSSVNYRIIRAFTPPGHYASSPTQMPKTAPGFATLSALQSSDSDIQIFRRFSQLSTRNLAYLQAEMVALEVEIDAMDVEDRKIAFEKPRDWIEHDLSARSWEVMERKAREGSERDFERMTLVKKLRALTAEYQDALIRQSRMLDLEKPAARSRTAFTEWFTANRPLVGHSFHLLDSAAAEDDLVALRTSPDQDRLTSFLEDYAGFFFRSSKESHNQDWKGITYFPERAIHVIVSILSVFITAALLIGAIVALYFAEAQGLKLGLIALFTTVFAAGVGLLTNARKAELYAATAAYAAVLVVYVSNDGPAKSKPP